MSGDDATPKVSFSSPSNPQSWATSDYGTIEFANHAEAKKAEALFNQMSGELAALRAESAGKQAKIDALMFEWCPDEMTPAQIEEWGKHQRPAL